MPWWDSSNARSRSTSTTITPTSTRSSCASSETEVRPATCVSRGARSLQFHCDRGSVTVPCCNGTVMKKYLLQGVVFLVFFAIVGAVAYNIIKNTPLGGGDGAPPSKPPATDVGDSPLAYPLKCLNRVDRRLRDSHARYTSWVSEGGPTCQESN